MKTNETVRSISGEGGLTRIQISFICNLLFRIPSFLSDSLEFNKLFILKFFNCDKDVVIQFESIYSEIKFNK